MSKTAFMFPGQGSQFVGMGKNIYDNFETAKNIFKMVDEYSQLPITQLVFNGPEEELKRTIYTQNAILATSLAMIEVLNQECKVNPDYVLGHSLGELTALYAASSLNLKDVVELVALRSKLMENCPSGTMAAIIGMNLDNLESLVSETNKELQASTSAKIVIANYNLPNQLIVSGEIEAVENLVKKAKSQKAKGIMLKVGGAFHSPLMHDAAVEFAAKINLTKFLNAKISIVQNYDGQPSLDTNTIKEKLSKQISSPVKWFQSVQTLIDLGVDTFIEIGPNTVLSNLVQKYNTQVKVLNISDIETLKTFMNHISTVS